MKVAIRQYVATLKADQLPIQRVLLYGSYAKGRQHKWSDIDVCIISPKFKDSLHAMQYLWSKRNFNPNATIEPVGFNPKDFRDENETSLTREIKQHAVEMRV